MRFTFNKSTLKRITSNRLKLSIFIFIVNFYFQISILFGTKINKIRTIIIIYNLKRNNRRIYYFSLLFFSFFFFFSFFLLSFLFLGFFFLFLFFTFSFSIFSSFFFFVYFSRSFCCIFFFFFSFFKFGWISDFYNKFIRTTFSILIVFITSLNHNTTSCPNIIFIKQTRSISNSFFSLGI